MPNISTEALDLVLDMQDHASSQFGSWPGLKAYLIEAGYTPEDVVKLSTEVAVAAGRDVTVEIGDFS